MTTRRASLGAASAIPEGGRRCVAAFGIEVVVLRAGGRLHALLNRCPHANGRLGDGVLREEGGRPVVECPLHRWRFDLATGATRRDRHLRADVYPVVIEGDEVFVELPEGRG